MAAKAMTRTPATPEVVLPATLDITDLIAVRDVTSQMQRDAVKVLHGITDPAEFRTAFVAASEITRHDDERVSATVKVAEDIVKQGKAMADAHTAFRVALVAEYLRVFPKVSDSTLAGDLFGDDSNTRRKMVGRYRRAVRVIGAAKVARDKMGKDAGIAVPSVAQAVKAVSNVTAKDADKIIARVADGGSLSGGDDDTPAKVKMSEVVKRAERLVDGMRNVDPESVTPAQVAALKALVAKIDTLAASA